MFDKAVLSIQRKAMNIRKYTRRADKLAVGICSFWLGVGLLLVIGSLYMFCIHAGLLLTGHRVNGNIVGESCRKQDCSYMIEFKDINGKVLEASSASSSLSKQYTVEILFQQQPGRAPEHIRVNLFGEMWAAPIVMLILGLPLLVVGAHLLLTTLPTRRQSRKRS
ncbi:hypothetical protein [Chitinimonas taiwanensis]|uniref:DUF3592 domain-containing protein n=1 Tax=Chitinimonas taiwanensis DSM 18899 TaxID=1121279 RepID=A0A1K2HS96_9NEIS|nr:hypothetical protein [Chitinimonas taiwanensis]SFZ79417.1 hypothetical protein SAMN02745887_03599 [Chitinimonas taiwanensis DSM 18899]